MEDYSTYTRMTTVPAGIILDRIIHQQKKSKVDVASSAHMIPQRLNDLINGNRRFTPKNSMALEQSLGIDIAGFFYIIQAHHDIYTEQKNENSNNRPDLTRLTKTTFWDVDLEKIDWTRCMNWAIRRVLEYGTPEEIQEIARFYGTAKVKEIYANPSNFRLYDRVKKNFEEIRI